MTTLLGHSVSVNIDQCDTTMNLDVTYTQFSVMCLFLQQLQILYGGTNPQNLKLKGNTIVGYNQKFHPQFLY